MLLLSGLIFSASLRPVTASGEVAGVIEHLTGSVALWRNNTKVKLDSQRSVAGWLLRGDTLSIGAGASIKIFCDGKEFTLPGPYDPYPIPYAPAPVRDALTLQASLSIAGRIRATPGHLLYPVEREPAVPELFTVRWSKSSKPVKIEILEKGTNTSFFIQSLPSGAVGMLGTASLRDAVIARRADPLWIRFTQTGSLPESVAITLARKETCDLLLSRKARWQKFSDVCGSIGWFEDLIQSGLYWDALDGYRQLLHRYPASESISQRVQELSKMLGTSPS